jgi:DNA repair protein RecN (Recombination protein N)
MQKIATFSVEYKQLFERLESSSIELKDIAIEINQLVETVLNEPSKVAVISQKLQLIYTLQKKHLVQTVSELLHIQADLDGKVSSLDQLAKLISAKESQLELEKLALITLAEKIYQNRINNVPGLIEKLTDILTQLGMPMVQFKIELKTIAAFLANGTSEIQFLISTNKGSDFGLMKKVASGGELSRIMLAVKAILANYSNLPTLLFDEIDTGVSGEVANKMGDIMKEMSKKRQIFAITHLPQIAAKGNQHYKVFKTTIGQGTTSEIKLLSAEERVIEIAQILSGTEASDSAINHAKALLN